MQSDGKVIIAGNFTSFNGASSKNILRLSANGTIDNTFNLGSGFDSDVSIAKIQPDGKIIVAGSFTSYNGIIKKGIARIFQNGADDSSFNIAVKPVAIVKAIELRSNGKIIFGGLSDTQYPSIRQVNSNGSIDNTFMIGTGFNGPVSSMCIINDTNLFVGGSFNSYNSTATSNIAILKPNGSIHKALFSNQPINFIVKHTNDKYLVFGPQYYNQIYRRSSLARIDKDGNIDFSFMIVKGFDLDVNCIKHTSNNKILVGGNFTVFNAEPTKYFTQLDINGNKDNNFSPGTGPDGKVRTIAVQTDGKILIGGDFKSYNGIPRQRLARINSNGTLDLSFDAGNIFDSSVTTISLQNDGKILVGGYFLTFLTRLNSNGVVDGNFTPVSLTGPVCSSLILPDNRIVVAGDFSKKLIRLKSNGSQDKTVSGTGFDYKIECIKMLPGNFIVAGGEFQKFNGNTKKYLAIMDTSLNPLSGTSFYYPIRAIAVQQDGKFVFGSSYSGTIGGMWYSNVFRYTTSFQLDTSFHPDITNLGYGIQALEIQSDKKILIGGNFNSLNSTPKNNIARIIGGDSPSTNSINMKGEVFDVNCIFPNPSSGVFNLKNGYQVNEIYDLQGRKVAFSNKHQADQIDLTIQPKGIYFFHISSSDSAFIEKVIIK